MGVFYYLESCDSCQRIRKILDLPNSVLQVDIKKNPLTIEQLDALKRIAGSYEALFSKRAQRYKQQNLKDKNITESDYKALLLEHYTFLKRPVLWIESALFIGNSAQVVAAAKSFLDEK